MVYDFRLFLWYIFIKPSGKLHLERCFAQTNKEKKNLQQNAVHDIFKVVRNLSFLSSVLWTNEKFQYAGCGISKISFLFLYVKPNKFYVSTACVSHLPVSGIFPLELIFSQL